MSRFFRRRLVPLPTAWGWLVLIAAGAAIVAALGRAVGPWLAITAPARAPDGTPSKVLIVEGWLGKSELAVAAEYARAHGIEHVITSGGPDDDGFNDFDSYAARAAAALRPLLPGVPVDAVPAPTTARDRTYGSAARVRRWMNERQLPTGAIDVYSRGVHARRTRWLYEMAFGSSTAVGVIAGRPPHRDEIRWWTSSAATRAVMSELLGLGWTTCCFWPSPSDPDETAAAPTVGSPGFRGA